jgi:hypothetical protein
MKLALTIKDLTVSKHLVASEMAVVRGGINTNGDIDPGYSRGHTGPEAITARVSEIDVARMIDNMILHGLGGYHPANVGTGNPF